MCLPGKHLQLWQHFPLEEVPLGTRHKIPAPLTLYRYWMSLFPYLKDCLYTKALLEMSKAPERDHESHWQTFYMSHHHSFPALPIGIKEQIELPSAWSILVSYPQNVLQQRKLEAKGKETIKDKCLKKNPKQTPSLLGKRKRRRRTLHT